MDNMEYARPHGRRGKRRRIGDGIIFANKFAIVRTNVKGNLYKCNCLTIF